ncbi:hypothetical protein ACP70R_007204 [Stipagrostis hirtigluma subsp. patula]
MGEASPEPGGAVAGGAAGPDPARKGKSCKGCLYYSSMLKARGYNPICVGIPRSIPQVPNYVVDEPKEEAVAQGHDLRKFKYGCAGYSMFVDNRDGQGGGTEGKTLLPYCRGLELLVDSRLVERKPSTAEQGPAYVSKDAPTNRDNRDLQTWFKRSAGLVASGVAKNLNKTANYIKENVEDILYPDRRSPK